MRLESLDLDLDLDLDLGFTCFTLLCSALPSINPPLRLIIIYYYYYSSQIHLLSSYNLSSSARKVLLFYPSKGIETTVHSSGWWALEAVPGTTVVTHFHITHQYHFTLHIALPSHCLLWSLACLIHSLIKKTILCTTYSQLHPLLFCFISYNYCVDVG